VWTWGNNLLGQLGRGGTGGTITTPGQVPNLSNVVAIAGGDRFSLAVRRNGRVFAWGDNSAGQLGTNATAVTFTNRPVLVAGISNVVLISAPKTDDGGNGGGMHSLAMTVDGGTNRYWGWGDNTWGQVGRATNAINTYVPAPVEFCTRCQRCVQLGTSGSFTAQCTGTLVLYFNDDQLAFGNNAGSFTATVDGFGAVTVMGTNGAGVAVGIVTKGSNYTFSASGLCDRGGGNATDADGNPAGGCTSINITNSVCPAAKCFSLVGKIQ
jgi:hypothetical protein